jgi:SulP family sulfate permease
VQNQNRNVAPSLSFKERRWTNITGNGLRLLSLAWAQAPESMAYGLLALAPMGAGMAPRAMAMALLGAVVANVVAAVFGGGRLVTAPRAALSLLTAGLVAALVAYRGPDGPLTHAVVLGLVTLSLAAAGGLQMLLGALGIGSIVKYTPHPVRGGLMSAVSLLLLVGALPAVLGAGFGHGLAEALSQRSAGALLVAVAAMGATSFAGRRRWPVPPVLLGLLAGAAAHGLLGRMDVPAGPLVGVPVLTWQWFAPWRDAAWLVDLPARQALWLPMGVFATTVAALGALDTLLATSVIDGRLRRPRDANRELRAQGLANVLAGMAGGLPNSPSMQRSLALLDAAPRARRSVLVYATALLGLLVLVPQVLGWLPVAAIGGVLVLQGVTTIDPWLWRTPALLWRRDRQAQAYDAAQRRLLLDNWLVASTVVGISLALGLAAAVAVGGALAVLLFVRANMRQVVRSQHTGSQRRSMRVRSPRAAEALQRHGARTVLLELQGALFFGTADALRASLDGLPPTVATVVLDLFLVGEIDATGARILLEVAEDWAQHGRHVVAAEWSEDDPRRRVVEAIARSTGLRPLIFAHDVDRGLEAAEDRVLAAQSIPDLAHDAVDLEHTSLARGLDPAELRLLQAELCLERVAAGAFLFRQGDPADAFYVTLQGEVDIRLPGSQRRLVSFAPGTMIGEMAALTHGSRSADAVAETPLTVLRLSAEALERLRREQPALAAKLLNNIALHLAGRLRELTLDLSSWVTRTGLPPIPSALGPEPPDDGDRSEVL